VPEFDVNPITHDTISGPETEYSVPDVFTEVPRTRVREGLPAKFRMRHPSHYVEQLMGDAPIQAVRQIPLDQLEAPDVAADLRDLVASIREVGLLQPLLVVAREGSRFQLVAGRNRLAAAKQAGLTTVPCLVVNADAESASRLRAHTELRSIADVPAACPETHADRLESTDVLRATLSEITASMRFIDALIPIARTDVSGLRAALIVDAMSVEGDRATTLAGAATLFMRSGPPKLEPIDCAALLETIRREIRLPARLRGVEVQCAASIRLGAPVADRDALRTGWSALIHAVLAMARDSDRLEISLTAPRVRPAVILEVTLHSAAGAVIAEGLLDRDRAAQHPAGPAGAMMLSAASHAARLHGGRLSVHSTTDGLSITFVAPQPLDLF
jgi:hypothetical protein